MREIGAAIAAACLCSLSTMARAQDRPVMVRENLPKKAVCLVCSQGGEEHGEEKPAGGVAYGGKTYYFCNRREIDAFVKNPDAYLPAPLPRPAPAFALKTVAGETITSEQLMKNRVLLVDFWATWCGPCVKAMPELQKLHERLGADGRFSVVGISIDEEGAKKVAPFLAKSKTRFSYPMLIDSGDVWKQWGVKSLPTVLLVRDGRIIDAWSGKVRPATVEAAIRKALEAD
ncbi:MAG: redoxin family protein [Capsulimonadales bacterium]|nr:redoxin family protein [Capsulimonadales bacterium]